MIVSLEIGDPMSRSMVDKLLSGGHERGKDTLPAAFTVARNAKWNPDTHTFTYPPSTKWKREADALGRACLILGRYMNGDPPKGFIEHLRECVSNLSVVGMVIAEDGRSARWGNQQFRFTPMQAKVVIEIQKFQRESGLPVSEAKLQSEIGGDNFRVDLIFKPANKATKKREAHPAWERMIVRAGKGLYAIAEPG